MRSIFLFIFITILSINGEVYKLSLSFTLLKYLLLFFLLINLKFKAINGKLAIKDKILD